MKVRAYSKHYKKRLKNLKDDLISKETTFKRDLIKRVGLINWDLDIMKNLVIFICVKSKTKMNAIMDKMDEKDTTVDRDRLHTELIILDWIYFKLASM